MGSQDLSSSAGQLARQAADSRWVQRAARAGFLVGGVLHLLIGYLAFRVAWSGGGGKADQSGALALVAEHGWGRLLLWVGVLGFTALVVWQLGAALLGGAGAGGKAADRVTAAAKALVYGALAVTTASFARGAGASSGKQSRDATASVMQHQGGRVVVVLVGLAVLGVGGYLVHKGVSRGFRDDLAQDPGQAVELLGVAGYVAKGAALAIVGGLFVVAGLRRQADEATGLDGALRTLGEQPFGSVLLTVVALGLAAYGVYSLARARYARL